MNQRILGIDINIGQDGDYDKAVSLAKKVGAQSTAISINWNDIESSPGKYSDKNNLLYSFTETDSFSFAAQQGYTLLSLGSPTNQHSV